MKYHMQSTACNVKIGLDKPIIGCIIKENFIWKSKKLLSLVVA